MSKKKQEEKVPQGKSTPVIKIQDSENQIGIDGSVKIDDGTIRFVIYEKEMLRIEKNGDFYIRGNKTTNDEKVYKLFKTWLLIVTEGNAHLEEEIKNLKAKAVKDENTIVNVQREIDDFKETLIDYGSS